MAQGNLNIQMSIEGLQELIDNVRDVETIAGPVTTFMRQGAETYADGLREAVPIGADSRLRNSVQTLVEAREPYPTWSKAGPTVDYAEDVAFGTEPHWIPLRAMAGLKRWARLKLGDEDIAWQVRWWIGLRGTKGDPYHERARDNKQHAVLGLISDLMNRITGNIVRGV